MSHELRESAGRHGMIIYQHHKGGAALPAGEPCTRAGRSRIGTHRPYLTGVSTQPAVGKLDVRAEEERGTPRRVSITTEQGRRASPGMKRFHTSYGSERSGTTTNRPRVKGLRPHQTGNHVSREEVERGTTTRRDNLTTPQGRCGSPGSSCSSSSRSLLHSYHKS